MGTVSDHKTNKTSSGGWPEGKQLSQAVPAKGVKDLTWAGSTPHHGSLEVVQLSCLVCSYVIQQGTMWAHQLCCSLGNLQECCRCFRRQDPALHSIISAEIWFMLPGQCKHDQVLISHICCADDHLVRHLLSYNASLKSTLLLVIQ
jgi:hypothetical protein